MPRYDLKQLLEAVTEYRAHRLYVSPPVVLALASDPLVDSYDLGTVEAIISNGAPLGTSAIETAEQRIGAHLLLCAIHAMLAALVAVVSPSIQRKRLAADAQYIAQCPLTASTLCDSNACVRNSAIYVAVVTAASALSCLMCPIDCAACTFYWPLQTSLAPAASLYSRIAS
eukprot:4239-Heterococcus_DN1.PRE.3